jgi:hypothetical protein
MKVLRSAEASPELVGNGSGQYLGSPINLSPIPTNSGISRANAELVSNGSGVFISSEII